MSQNFTPLLFRFDVAVMNYFFRARTTSIYLHVLVELMPQVLLIGLKKIEIEFTYEESKIEIDE